MPPPKDRKVVGSKWYYVNPTTPVYRLVAQDYSQKACMIEYEETFFLVVRFKSIRFVTNKDSSDRYQDCILKWKTEKSSGIRPKDF